jgi:hypothetical protein
MNAFVYPILDRVHHSNIPSLSSGENMAVILEIEYVTTHSTTRHVDGRR